VFTILGLRSQFAFRSYPVGVSSGAQTYLLHGAQSIFVKLTGFQLVKKFPAFYRTRGFITAFTSARQLSLSWGCPIYSTQIPRSAFPKILGTEHVLT